MDPIRLTMPITAIADGSEPDAPRTLGGTIVRYGVVHYALSGPVQFEPGSLGASLPEDLSRVKLIRNHDAWSEPVGYLTRFQDDAAAANADFAIPPGPDGDSAIASAQNHLTDGFSVGVIPTEYTWDEQDIMHVTAGALYEVSLTAFPADTEARTARIAATRKDPTMDHENDADGTAAPANEPPAPSGPGRPAHAQAPAPMVAARTRPVSTIAAAAGIVSTMARAGDSAAAINAALATVADTGTGEDGDYGEGFLRPAWLGELWQATVANRPLIDASTKRPLTSGTKVYGFQWDQTGTVDQYAGDLTQVPSTKVTTKPIESSVVRIAGGNRVDRIFVDMAEPGLLEALFSQYADDYKRKTETYHATQTLASATDGGTADSLVGALNNVGMQFAGIGASLDFCAVASDVWAQVVAMTREEVPWIFGTADKGSLTTVNGNIGGVQIFTTPSLAAGQVLCGDKRATQYFEASQTPIRVQAVEVADGGIDIAVFGYIASLQVDPRALVKVQVSQ